jgi:hypothetical protein
MKYVMAIGACIGIVFLYGIIGAALGFRNGGGLIPVLILMATLAATWNAIANKP